MRRTRQLEERLKAGHDWVKTGLVFTTFARRGLGRKVGVGLHRRNVLRTLHKRRPAVVLAALGRGDHILCQVTSNPYGDAGAIELDDTAFASGLLRVTSHAPRQTIHREPRLGHEPTGWADCVNLGVRR